MPPPFKKITLDEFRKRLKDYPFSRKITSVHMHHTWRPNHAQYSGHETIVGMWRHHTTKENFSDIAQHLTIGPNGELWLGRDWNKAPASAVGYNGNSAAGPFMFEMIGDFDEGEDPFGGAQREAALQVIHLVQQRFGLPPESLRFHNQMSTKTCPGETIDYKEIVDAVRVLSKKAKPKIMELSSALAVPGADAEVPEADAELFRSALLAPMAEEPETAELGATEAFFGPKLSIDVLETLRPHVVNLSRGRFSTGGKFSSSKAEVDAIFGEHIEKRIASTDEPLRIVIWAHGGLVNEEAGLKTAAAHIPWWNRNGVYPLYFVWETGLMESLQRVMFGPARMEAAFIEFTDRLIEEAARKVGGIEIWSDMKATARLASEPDGGAAYVAQKLRTLVESHPGKVELHAVGHSAGAIFHSYLLPLLFREDGPGIRSLQLLAPALRVDEFEERLRPHIGGKIEQLAMFTMNRLRELDDNCLGAYRKSLLYLIHHGLEKQPGAPLLGLEESIRASDSLLALFGLGAHPKDQDVDVVWSKSSPDAGPRDRSHSTAHGDFDDDHATLESIARRVLDRDSIVPFAASANFQEFSGELESLERMAEALPDLPEVAEAEMLGADVPDLELAAFALDAAPLTVRFGPNARPESVTAYSLQVLREIMRNAGLSSVVISSTSRDPANQARVMYANLERFGVAHQKRLYGAAGDQVIQVYARGKARGEGEAAIRAAMTRRIVEIGPTKVSRHASDPNVLNVFDVAPSSVARPATFVAAVRADRRVSHFITPPQDPGYHLEIPQPR